MKILFVSSGKKNNQPGPIISSQAESLEKQHLDVQHFTINEKGITGYLKECSRLLHLLKLKKFDIIHAHYGLTAIVCLLARRREKLVVSFMGDDLVGSNREDGSITRKSLLLAKLNAMFARWFFDYSIVKSREMLSCIRTHKVSLIPNGVDTELFWPGDKTEARNKLGIELSEKVAIFVSKTDRAEKNYKLAQQAVELISKPNLQLIPVSGIIQSEIVNYYNAADLVLLTSFHEGSPNIIKEAMVCNCTVVSTDVGDVKWLLGDTEGCYIASFNPKDFGEKIKMALEFSAIKGRTTGRKRIIQLGLDAETVARKIIDVYKKVLD